MTICKIIKKPISLLLIFTMVISMSSCSGSSSEPTLSSPNQQVEEEHVVTESTVTENIITENMLTEFITSEIYLQEMVVAEDKITELLLEEESIDEVTFCKTIYVPEKNLEDFAEHSQTAELFGEDFDIKPILQKIAIGTGVIVTTVILKKVGVPKPIASVVVAAADESLKFAKTGAVVGSLFGAFTGAADDIDESGRASAIGGFALATVGLIVTSVSLVAAIPTGGTTGFGVAEGIHLAWAGVQVMLTATATVYAARDTVKAFTSTDVSDIDWDNIDWDRVGVSSAQKAIQNGADGYMWGAVYGAIDGSVEGYYRKYCTPYTQYQDRLNHTPKNGDRGKWTGERGESDFVLNEPIVLSDGTKITNITYQNAVPDFSPYAIAEVKIPNMTNERLSSSIKNVIGNFEQADTALAEYWTQIKYNNRTWSSVDVRQFRESYPYKLTWHEMTNMEYMQLVPYDVNNTFGHYGGVAEYNAMIGQKGEVDYD